MAAQGAQLTAAGWTLGTSVHYCSDEAPSGCDPTLPPRPPHPPTQLLLPGRLLLRFPEREMDDDAGNTRCPCARHKRGGVERAKYAAAVQTNGGSLCSWGFVGGALGRAGSRCDIPSVGLLLPLWIACHRQKDQQLRVSVHHWLIALYVAAGSGQLGRRSRSWRRCG